MNAPMSPPPFALSAKDLAAMLFTEGRQALAKQECAFMQHTHARSLLRDLQDRGDTVGRVECTGLCHGARRFHWTAFEACDACVSTGSLIGADQKEYPCPNCSDLDPSTFLTDYDGQLIEESCA